MNNVKAPYNVNALTEEVTFHALTCMPEVMSKFFIRSLQQSSHSELRSFPFSIRSLLFPYLVKHNQWLPIVVASSTPPLTLILLFSAPTKRSFASVLTRGRAEHY